MQECTFIISWLLRHDQSVLSNQGLALLLKNMWVALWNRLKLILFSILCKNPNRFQMILQELVSPLPMDHELSSAHILGCDMAHLPEWIVTAELDSPIQHKPLLLVAFFLASALIILVLGRKLLPEKTNRKIPGMMSSMLATLWLENPAVLKVQACNNSICHQLMPYCHYILLRILEQCLLEAGIPTLVSLKSIGHCSTPL